MKWPSFNFIFPFCIFLFSFTPTASSHNILFYYNSEDGTGGALLQCVTILQESGNQVTTINVKGENRDPHYDNWGPPYDQVWDMRFVNRDSTLCGSGRSQAADYFDEHWRNKAVSFLNHCGLLFIAAEHYPLVDRNEGLYAFLKEIHAVKNGFDICPPSTNGNNSTLGEGYYPVRHGLGPVSFYGAWVGGIPLAYLTGTSFVETSNDWEGDQVDRSIVSGWLGNQLGGAVNVGLCGRGKLFMVWDATMWTLWQPGMYEEEKNPQPIWDDSAWFSWSPKSLTKTDAEIRRAKEVTRRFFSAISKWLGSKRCPCTEASKSAIIPTPTPAMGFPYVISPNPTISNIPISVGSLLTAANGSSTVTSEPTSNNPATIVFAEYPVNIFVRFRDGIGEYKVLILDSKENPVRKIFDKPISSQKEAWATWDGSNFTGQGQPNGIYYAVLYKDNQLLRKIVLIRTRP